MVETFSTMYHQLIDNHYDFGTGSWAVASNKIQMKLDQYGEYHPYLVDPQKSEFSESELTTLKETCLSLSSKNEADISKELYAQIPHIHYNQQLGYYSDLYVGHVTEGDFRANGSSGGFGTWIFKELLANHEIDGVLHVKPSNKPDKLFEYGISQTVDEIIAGAKTKYYPVEYSEVIKTVKQQPGKYAIIGLPSYIMEIRLLAEQDLILKERIKFTIGLVCGHQKSTKFAEFLAWQCGIQPGDLETINFRKKLPDMPASQYAIEVTGTINGEEKSIVKPMKELVGRDWGEALFKVRASDFTDDVMNETADVTLGDAWLPEYTSDSKGNNVIIVRHPVIKAIIEAGIKDGKVKVDKVDAATIFRSQGSHYRHTRVELGYRLYKQIKAGHWVPKKRTQPSKNFPWHRRKIQDIREKICLNVPEMYLKATNKSDLAYFMQEIKPLRTSYRNLYRNIGRLRKFAKMLHLMK